ncbi:uncharacterized protein B0I36DRAFT_388060 [Microdochium trichocladiopsis]|uniref:Uncharacterized protein n=1 Tax=Microdochium trichocladiopsis TaxID=1682393 RepID=A0A9P8XYF6_9PEZI|nr:uncharacterized protein B0I36DRAFT_388060 [Microdochium trichocladiopsis]KAH7021330.1 hypothetical protein B0I36DRAFT_388060 [Microdochium trichocladiopsis]
MASLPRVTASRAVLAASGITALVATAASAAGLVTYSAVSKHFQIPGSSSPSPPPSSSSSSSSPSAPFTVTSYPASATAPASFTRSRTVTDIINHAGHRITQDSRTVEVRAPKGGCLSISNSSSSSSKSALSDEEILARFVRAFFGGVVFAPEGVVLRALGRRMAWFSKVPTSSAALEIWSKHDLSLTHLPPVSSILFGAFQVLDAYIADEHHQSQRAGISDMVTTRREQADTAGSTNNRGEKEERTQQPGAAESYVDIGFGSDGSWFAGTHRFTVSRYSGGAASTSGDARASGGRPADGARKGDEIDDHDHDEAEAHDVLKISFHGMTCNPRVDRPENALEWFMFRFHRVYADLLFRESVAVVLRHLEERAVAMKVK